MTQLQSLKRKELTMEPYKVLMHGKTFQKAKSYLKDLAAEKITPGSYLKHQLGKTDLSQLDIKDFIERLVRTKKPQIFAESAVAGDGTDWNLTELSILGDVGIPVPVHVFDNGMHSLPWPRGMKTNPSCARLKPIKTQAMTSAIAICSALWPGIMCPGPAIISILAQEPRTTASRRQPRIPWRF